MKFKIVLGITSVILLVFTLIVGLSRYSLVLVEYGSSLSGFSELHRLPVIQALLPVCVFLTVIFSTAFVIVIKKDVTNGKRFWILFVIGIVISGVAIGKTISVSYKTAIFDEHYADVTLSDEDAIKINPEYKQFFPYYDKFYEYVGDEFYFSYSRCDIPQATYIHIQNFSWYEDDALYDVEYFETDDISLLGQYNLQKTVPVFFEGETLVHLEGVTKTINDIEYLIYQHEAYYEIRIKNDKSYYSIVFKNFDEMIELDETTFTETAMKQYELIRTQRNGSSVPDKPNT